MIREESEKDLELEDEVEQTLMKKKFSDSSLPPVKTNLENDAAKIASQTLPGNTKLRHRNSSPIMRRRPQINNPNVNNMARRSSKTLPRGFSLANAAAGDSLDCDVFGLYGELLNVRDYDCDSGERIAMTDELRKSDPELSTIPYRVNTLDRRVRMKTSRPRSLDMSSWSVESRSSSGQTTSSSEAGSERPSPNVSRNASFQSNSGGSVASPPPPQQISSGPASITSTTSTALTTLTTTTTTQVVKWKDHPNKMEAR